MNWNKIRTEFFDQCTEDIGGLKKVNLAPHDLFNWFKDKCCSLEDEIVTTKEDIHY